MTALVSHLPPESPLERLTDAASDVPIAALDATSSLLEQIAGTRRTVHAKQVAVTRILRALSDLAEQSDATTMARAAGEESDYAVLLALLDQPEVLDALRTRDPLAPARLRGLQSRDSLLASEGGTLSAREVGATLGITRQAVDNRRKRGKLLAVELGRRGFAYPIWQFNAGRSLPGLDLVLDGFAGASPWAFLAFMLNSNAWLDAMRPLDALRAGNVEGVIRAASLYGEQNAA